MADLQDAQAGLPKASEKSRDEAVAQSEVKSHFLATMSHEIRTPMNGVIGLSSLLLGTDLDPIQVRYAAGIHAAGNVLLGVINDILDFSKIEADKLVLDVDDFELSAVLTAVTALVNPAAQQKGLTVVTRCDPRLPTMVRGDGGRLRQILLNIVGNAVKFTPRGSVTLRVTQDTSVPIIPSSPPAETPRGTESVRATSPTPQHQLRILLAEDNDINQMIAVGILTELGYHVTVANDGVEAVDLAAADTYDAILMDCRMPRMDGFNATLALRRSEGERRHTPIIAMTASALAADREACLAAGMDDYMTKPITATELKDVLHRWTTGRATEAAADTNLNAAPETTNAAGQRPTRPSAERTPQRQH